MQKGVLAAITLTAALAGAAPAYADDQTITADDDVVFTPEEVTIDVGDTVTWSFDNPVVPHNVVAKSDSPTAWATGDENNWATNHDDVVHTFDAAGTYTFQCQVHPDMDGTVIVGDGGPPPDDPPPDDPPPDDDPSSSPPPTGGTHPTTPAPSPGTDTVKPTVKRVKLKALRRAVRVRFRVSEPASVTVRVKRGRKVLKSKRVQAGAGTHSVTLRSKKLKKGRYTVEILARDAYGNRSRLAKKRLSVRT
jgi:plastocyanin